MSALELIKRPPPHCRNQWLALGIVWAFRTERDHQSGSLYLVQTTPRVHPACFEPGRPVVNYSSFRGGDGGMQAGSWNPRIH